MERVRHSDVTRFRREFPSAVLTNQHSRSEEGLENLLDEERITAALLYDNVGQPFRKRVVLQQATDELVERVYAGGAPDNVTTIVARVEGDDLPEPPEAGVTTKSK